MSNFLGGFFGGTAAGKPAAAPAPAQKKPGQPVGAGSAIPFGAQQSGGASAGSFGRPSSGSNAGFQGPAFGSGTRSGSGAGLPGANEGGGDLFGSLSLKGGSAAAPSGGSGLLSGLNVGGSAATAAPQATGFNFMSAPAPAASVPAATGFDFLGSSAAAPAAAAPSAFPFAASAAVPAPAAAPVPAAAHDAAADAAGGIRKKKGGFRPGFDRSGGAEGGAGAGPAAPGGLLSGLAVHEATGDEADASGGPSSLLAGMTVHADAGGEDGSGGPASMLAGLQPHGAEAAPAPAPAEGGSAFAMLLAASQGGQASPRVADVLPSSAAPVVSAPAAPAASGFSFGQASTTAVSSGASVFSPAMAAATATATSSSDPTARKKAHIAALHEAARSTRLHLADVKIRLRSLAEEDKAAAAEVERLRAKVGEVEAAQDEAVRTEAFEDAERLSNQLDSIKGSLTVAETKREAVRARRKRAEEEQEAALEEQLAVANECLAGVKSYEGDRTSALSSFLREATSRHLIGADRIKGEEEQLRLKEEHVARESVLVGEEEQQVERAISEQTEELNKSVRELRERHTRLTDEVAELERLLEAKRREQKAAASSLADTEAKIATIRMKFDKQAKRLQAKRQAVEVEKEECSHEAAAIARAKKEYAAAKAKDRAAERAMLRQAGHASQDVGTLEELRASLLGQETKRRGLAEHAAQASTEVAAAGDSVNKAVKALRAVQARKAALEGQARAARKTIDGIDGRIPSLNEEKKQAVAGKKFKEAARVNDELKRLADQREQAERELSEATSGIDAADQEALVMEGDLSKAKESLEGVKKDKDMARLALLTDAYKTVAIALRKVARRLPPVSVKPQVHQVDSTTLETLSDQDDEGEPDNEELGIEIDVSSHNSAAQQAAVELLTTQRDALNEELSALAGRYGVTPDLRLPEADSSSVEQAAEAPAQDSAPVVIEEEAAHESSGQPSVLAGLTLAHSENSTPVAAADVTPSALGFLAGSTPTPEAAAGVVAVSGFAALLGGAGAADAAEPSPTASGLPFLASEAQATESVPAVSGFPGLGGVEAGEVSSSTFAIQQEPEAVAQAAPSYTYEALMAAKASRLKRAALTLSSIASAVTEKEGLISEAVGREDYDNADSLQADIDDLLEHKGLVLAPALALGISSEEELLGAGYLEADVDEELAATIPADLDLNEAMAVLSGQAMASAATGGTGAEGFLGMAGLVSAATSSSAAGSAAPVEGLSAVGGFPFAIGSADSTPVASMAMASGLAFLSGGEGSALPFGSSTAVPEDGQEGLAVTGLPYGLTAETGATNNGTGNGDGTPVATGFSFM